MEKTQGCNNVKRGDVALAVKNISAISVIVEVNSSSGPGSAGKTLWAACRDFLDVLSLQAGLTIFPTRSSACLGPSEVAAAIGGQLCSQLAPRRPLAPQKQEMVIVLRRFSSPYLYPHSSLWMNRKKEEKQMCNNTYVWKKDLGRKINPERYVFTLS